MYFYFPLIRPVSFFSLFVLLFFSFLTSSSLAQSTPSQTGALCLGNGLLAYADSSSSACSSVCSSFNGNGGIPMSYSGGSYCTQGDGSIGIPLTVRQVAVCLTGSGWQAADPNGFCPDPPSQDDGDDDDGDGSDCDTGEESGLDCNDGDLDDIDSDNDGEPDSVDNDDGICSEFNDGDLDCDGACDTQDTPNSSDCQDQMCSDGEKRDIGIFDVSQTFNIPQTVCAADNCVYENDNGVGAPFDCTPPNGDFVSCKFIQTGDTCGTCTTPSCQETECPEGQTRDINTLACGPIEDFCDLDDNNDGIPDNADSFACDDDDECDPDTEDCRVVDPNTTYACEESPPICPSDASAVDCALLQQGYQLRCAAVIQQSDTCDVEFNCSLADPALCAIAHTNYLSLCRYKVTDEELAEIDRLVNPTDSLTQAVDSGDVYYGEVESEGSVIDLTEIDLSNDTFQFNGSIDGDYSADTSFGTATTDVNPFLSLLDVLKALIILSAGIYSLRTINRAHSS